MKNGIIDKKQENSIRPPVVVVLGHVDHGKTSILDYIKKTKTAENESGGITQHIGAYQVETEKSKITFLDTPGHEAFSAIRSRGAKAADIGLLVVAADEGVKPQTKEAIKILNESNIPFIIAINKIDKPEANSQRIKQELSENEILIEEWGGKIPVVEISAKTGQGIDELLEMILLMAELEELKINLAAPASGMIIESRMDNKRGALGTLLNYDGILRQNDWIVAGENYCKIKMMEDFLGNPLKEVIPSQPALILGWSVPPTIGQQFERVASKKEAEEKVRNNLNLGKNGLFQSLKGPKKENKKNLNLIIKADATSSLEAIEQAIGAIKSDEIGYNVISYGIGAVSDGDVKSAASSQAKILGFNVEIPKNIRLIAERDKIDVSNFDIIYDLVENTRKNMEDMLDPEIRKIPFGKVKILAVFKNDEKTQIVGGKVTSGKAARNSLIDIVRNKVPLISGKLSQLQHNKAEVEEVKEGLECGIKFELPKNSNKPMLPIRVGDMLEIYQEEKIKRSIG